MAGSVRRLTILVVMSTLPNYSILQRSKSFIQNPFQFKTNFLRDFMMMRDEIFPFTFSTSADGFYIPKSTLPPPPSSTPTPSSPSLAEYVLRHQLHPLKSESSNVVKRRIPRPVLENEKVQNFILQKIGNEPEIFLKRPLGRENYQNITKNLTKLEEDYPNLTPLKINDINISSPENSTFLDIKDIFVLYKNTNVSQSKNSTETGNTKGDDESNKTSFLGYVISTLTQLPIIGNVLRASVDPLYRPIVNRLQTGKFKGFCFSIIV